VIVKSRLKTLNEPKTRNEPMTNVQLYLATPVLDDAEGFLPALDAALDAGRPASLLLRLSSQDEESAKRLVRKIALRTEPLAVALVIDGSAELALAANADGAQIAGAGPALKSAVERLSPRHIVGAAGLTTRHDAMNAGEIGADYVLFGDGSAPLSEDALEERLRWWAEVFTTPCVAFASTLAQAPRLVRAGADFVMFGDCVWGDSRGPGAAMKDALYALTREEA
jgi:thiamine-phosphate pyrophosphorylase